MSGENSAKAPHLLFVSQVDDEMNVQWAAMCPWEPDDRTRDCLLGEEPPGPCLWDHWDMSKHHPECADEELCIAVVTIEGEEGVQACWDARPEECDGFTSVHGDHLHLTDGCGVNEAAGWAGWGESVYFLSPVYNPSIPMHVYPSWDGESGCELTVVDPPQGA